MNDQKIQLLAKWFSNQDKRFWPEDDPDIELLEEIRLVATKAYNDGGRWSEGAKAASEAVIRFVIEMP